MSGKQSNLTDPHYGYDMVVAVTQESINATLKLFLDKYEGTDFVQSYVFNPNAPKGTDKNVPIEFEALKKTLGFDPFTVENGTPLRDKRIQALKKQKFTFAFKTEIGLPDFQEIPDPIVMNKEGSYVTYNMVCRVFEIIILEPVLYADNEWINLKQSEAEKPWIFQFTVDINLQKDDLTNHFHLLPPKKQQQIKSLGADMFSIQQLFLDLNSAALSDSHEIKGLDPTSTAYIKLTSVFFGEYFKKLSEDGGVMLGFSVTAKKKSTKFGSSIIPTNLNFEICSFKDSKLHPTDNFELYTLNYLIMSNLRALPAPAQFAWNWIDDNDERKDYHGTMSIKKGVFVDFLNSKFSLKLKELCYSWTVKYTTTCNNTEIEFKPHQDRTDQEYHTTHNDNDTSQVLTYSYNKPGSDSDSKYCVLWLNLGNASIEYSVSSDVFLKDKTIEVKTQVKAKLHFNICGGITEGDFAKYNVDTNYILGVYDDGTIFVRKEGGEIVDNSENIKPDWWSKTVSAGQIKTYVKDVQTKLKEYTRNHLSTFETDIMDMLNSSHTWVFPGGKTFIFKDIYFSDKTDLVTHVTYVDPDTE